jgi:hypothetical protein
MQDGKFAVTERTMKLGMGTWIVAWILGVPLTLLTLIYVLSWLLNRL